MIYIKEPDYYKFYTIKYSKKTFSQSQINELLNDGYIEILEDELSGKILPLLTIDSFDMFPLKLLEDCKIVFLDIHSHFEMNDESFQMLRKIIKYGGIEWGYTGYSEWYQAQKRMETIKNIIG